MCGTFPFVFYGGHLSVCHWERHRQRGFNEWRANTTPIRTEVVKRLVIQTTDGDGREATH